MATPSGSTADARRLALATGMLSVDAVVEAARQAEALGYEAVLVGEARMEADAFLTAAAVLRVTDRVRCGPGVVNAYERHPMALARAAATLDQVAAGRALLGVGRGERAYVSEVLGLPWSPSPLPAVLETVRPLLSRRVPLLLAAVGPRALRLAGAAADGVLLNYGAPLEYVRWAVALVRDAAVAAGRDPAEVDVYGYLLVAADEPRLESVRRTLTALFEVPEQAAALSAQTGGPPSRWDDGALRRHAVVGTREECLARIEEYRAAGVRCPVLMPSAMRALHGSLNPA